MKNIIIQHPSPKLRQVCEPVEFDRDLPSLSNKLRMALSRSGGLAVAAPQIGILKRAYAYNLNGSSGVCYNPEIVEIVEKWGSYDYPEGCLSIPDKFLNLKRPRMVILKQEKPDGTFVESACWDLEAVMAQHELDHLNGKLIIDEHP